MMPQFQFNTCSSSHFSDVPLDNYVKTLMAYIPCRGFCIKHYVPQIVFHENNGNIQGRTIYIYSLIILLPIYFTVQVPRYSQHVKKKEIFVSCRSRIPSFAVEYTNCALLSKKKKFHLLPAIMMETTNTVEIFLGRNLHKFQTLGMKRREKRLEREKGV